MQCSEALREGAGRTGAGDRGVIGRLAGDPSRDHPRLIEQGRGLAGLVRDAPGAPVVLALDFGDLGHCCQAGTVEAPQPLLVPGAEVVAGGADDHHAVDVLRGGAVPVCAQRGAIRRGHRG